MSTSHVTTRWSTQLPDAVVSLKYSVVSMELAAATFGGAVHCVDARSGQPRAELSGHKGGNLAVAWSPTEALLATSGLDRSVHLEARDGRATVVHVDAGADWVGHLAWASDGASFATAAKTQVRLWSKDGAPLSEYGDHVSTVSSLVWYEQSECFISACYGMIQLLSRDRLALARALPFRASVLRVAPSPTTMPGPYVALGCQDPFVHVWDMRDEDNEINLLGYASKVDIVTWSEAAPLLATASGKAVVVWKFGATGTVGQPVELRHHDRRVRAVRFATGGERLFSAANDGRVCIYDCREGARGVSPMEIIETASPVTALEPVPGGMAWVTAQGELGMWGWD